MLAQLRTGNKRTKTIWWVLTVVTVITFVGGFIFLAGVGSDQAATARMSGAYGLVGDRKITRDMWQTALEDARAAFRRQYGNDPADRDAKVVEQQAWRGLVSQQLFAREAERARLGATDAEVLQVFQTSPPQALVNNPAFQTNGQFDAQKYVMAIRDPNNNWAGWEELVRQQLPVSKLETRLLSSLKLTQPELLEAFHDRFDQLRGVVVIVPPAESGKANADEAALQKVYDKYKDRMATGPRTQLEVLVVPKKFSAEETKAAMDLANSLRERAERGEDFGQLARDFSEGPGADRGGVIDRNFNPTELGPILGGRPGPYTPGTILPPYAEGSRVSVFKIVDPATDTSLKTPPVPGTIRLAQIVLKVRPSSEALRAQYEDVLAIAKRAKSVGLAKAATEKAMSTTKTSFYDWNNEPPQLFQTPEAGDWGLVNKVKEVSPVFEGPDVFTVVQVAAQHAPGPPSREELGEQLGQIADVEHRVQLAKPRADALAAAVKGGQPLEAAATALGLVAQPVQMARMQPAPQLMGSPEVQGALWAARPGQVVGPIRTTNGWVMGRVDGLAPADTAMFTPEMKGQLTQQILTQRQRTFFEGMLQKLRADAKVKDYRAGEQM